MCDITFSIRDFIPTFPDREIKGMAALIAARKEFTMKDEDVTSDPILREHQVLVQRFLSPLSPVNGMLFYHELGSGKTCSAAAVAEIMKNVNVRGSQRPPALIIVSNRTLAKEFRRQIVEVCTKDEYEDPKDLKKYYRIVTREAFTNRLSDPSKYNDRVIIIDEVHNLRAGKTYNKIKTFLHKVKRCKVILLTGTPLWDHPKDYASIMNLILPTDEQFDESQFNHKYYNGEELTTEGADIISDRSRGRVSYVQSAESDARRIHMGDQTLDGVQLTRHIKVVPSVARGVQLEAILARPVNVTTNDNEMRQSEVHDANFVWPKSRFGGVTDGVNGFQNYAMVKGGKKEHLGLNTSQFPNIIEQLGDTLEDLENFSSKFATILRYIRDNPREKVFIFTNLVVGSNALLFALMLQKYLKYRWIKTADQADGKQPTFAVITSHESSTHTPTTITEMIERFNQYDNRYGEYVQVIIGSTMMAEGFTLKDVRQVHIMNPHWNLSRTDQAIGRAIRYHSHEHLPEDERYVKSFYHVTIADLTPRTDDTTVNIDLDMYRVAEEKDYKNAQIRQILKKVAIDCYLRPHEAPHLEDGSRECDYTLCNYKCETPEDETILDELDNPTYTLQYAKPEIQRLVTKIKSLFSQNTAMRFEDICKEVDGETLLLVAALDHIIGHKIPIRNSYGFLNYLKEDHDVYYIDTEYGPTKYMSSIYAADPFVTQRLSLKDYLDVILFRRDRELMKNLTKDGCPNLASIGDQLSMDTKVMMLEHIYTSTGGDPSDREIDFLRELIEYTSGGTVLEVQGIGLVHNLYGQSKMRVWDQNTQTWDYLTDEKDIQTVINEIQHHEESDMFTEFLFHGKVVNDDRLILTADPETKKLKGKGMRAAFAPALDLLTYLDQLNALKEPSNAPTRIQMIRDLSKMGKSEYIKNMDTGKLRRFWAYRKQSKKELADLLFKHLRDRNMIIYE